MQSEPKVTIDHEEIKNWAKHFGGWPQRVDMGGVNFIRIDFPGKFDDTFLSSDKPPRYISWEEFFAIFDELDLAFIYEEKDVLDPSLGYHFIKRDHLSEEEAADERIFG